MMNTTAGRFVLLAILVTTWGSAYALSKLAVTEIDPLTIVALRFAFGGAILAAVMISRGEGLPLSGPALAWFGGMGVMGFLVPHLAITWAVGHIDSALAGILLAATPFGILVLGHLLLADEKITRAKAAGFLLGFAGMVVLFAPKLTGNVPTGLFEILGMLAVLGASLCFATQAVTARRMPPMSAVQKAAGSVIAAAIGGWIALLVSGGPGPIPIGQGLAATIVLGLVPSGLTIVVLYRLIETAGPGFIALSNYLIPLYAVGLGALMFGERLPATTFVALALVLGGLFVTERGAARR